MSWITEGPLSGLFGGGNSSNGPNYARQGARAGAVGGPLGVAAGALAGWLYGRSVQRRTDTMVGTNNARFAEQQQARTNWTPNGPLGQFADAHGPSADPDNIGSTLGITDWSNPGDMPEGDAGGDSPSDSAGGSLQERENGGGDQSIDYGAPGGGWAGVMGPGANGETLIRGVQRGLGSNQKVMKRRDPGD